jgi:hypothetical protein
VAALRNRVKRLINIQSDSTAHKVGSPQAEYLEAIAAAYEAGFAFHQKAVRESTMLLAWVLRPDYWEAQVPGELGGRRQLLDHSADLLTSRKPPPLPG